MPSPAPRSSRRPRHLLDPMRRLSETGRQAVVARAGRRTGAILLTSGVALCVVVALVAGWLYPGSTAPTATSTDPNRASGVVGPAPVAPAAPASVAPDATPDGSGSSPAGPDGSGSTAARSSAAAGPTPNSSGDGSAPKARVAVRSEPESPPVRATAKDSSTATGAPKKAVSAPTASATGKKITIDLTGYSYQDNTPPGSAEVSSPVLHQNAGGTGTFSDPITVAVPDDGSFSPGSKFYLPVVKRYVIVEDSGASSASDSAGEHLDLWSDGRGASKSEVDDCISQFTGTTTAEVKPPPGRPVLAGPIFSKGVCRLP